MASKMKRMTFTVPTEMVPLLERTKKEMFYKENKSDMLRKILTVGLDCVDKENKKGEKNICKL